MRTEAEIKAKIERLEQRQQLTDDLGLNWIALAQFIVALRWVLNEKMEAGE